MSGAAFEGLGPRPAESQGYRPSEPGFDAALVDEVMRWHLDAPGITPHIGPLVTDLAAVIGDIPGQFDCQAFIDALVTRLALSGEDTFATDSLFSPLIQHFYNQGRNGLSLDLTPLETDYYWTMLANLHGTESSPLEVSLRGKGDIYHCCEYTSHCRLTLQGNVYVLGLHSTNSEFVFAPEGDLATVRVDEYGGLSDGMTSPCVIGVDAEHCVFKLPGYSDARMMGRPKKYQERSIRLTKHDGAGDLCEVKWDFFNDGNRLLVPDGKGGWKGVRSI